MYEDRSEAPVKVGETYEVAIQSIGEKGDGIARIKGFVLFIPKVKKGDFVKVRVTKVLKNVGFAEVVGQLEGPPKDSKYATFTKEELNKEEQEENYQDTENFGDENQ